MTSVRAAALHLTLAVGLSLALPALGCSSTVAQGPSDALRSYASALEQGRVDDAYRMLSDEAKRSMSLEAYRRAVQENPQDAVEIARSLARPASDPVITATITVPNGEELVLVYEGGRWRLDAAAVDLYGQSTPRQALLGFLRAFERRRYDVILRLVPDSEKSGIPGTEDVVVAAEGEKSAAPKRAQGVELTAEKLKAAWEGPQKEYINGKVQAFRTGLATAHFEETGDTAAMSYGAGGTVAFIREHGVWKIKDF